MSKQLAFTENANIAWDLHEKNEVTPLDFTEENKVDLFGIEPIKANEMVSGLQTTILEREVLKNAYVDVIELEINTANLPIFKELRLKLVKNRTSIESWHKNNKAFYLAGGRFVDAIKNKEIEINKELESKLLEAEKFFENQEKEKVRVLNEQRIEKLKPFIEDITGLDFTAFSDEDFDDYVLGKKTKFKNEAKAKKEAEEKAESERLAEIERQKAIEIENAKLKLEAEEKELAIQKERAEFEAKQKAIQDEADKKAREEKAKQDAILKAEQEAKAKIEAELQSKKDAEIKAENERIAKEKADKLEADKLAKAPVKKQLSVWMESFNHGLQPVENETTKEILAKFEAFKKWSLTQINNL